MTCWLINISCTREYIPKYCFILLYLYIIQQLLYNVFSNKFDCRNISLLGLLAIQSTEKITPSHLQFNLFIPSLKTLNKIAIHRDALTKTKRKNQYSFTGFSNYQCECMNPDSNPNRSCKTESVSATRTLQPVRLTVSATLTARVCVTLIYQQQH